MKSILALAFAATLAGAPFSFAADPANHAEHHPDTPATKPAQAKTEQAKSGPIATKQQMEKMDSQMKAMREMHEKMMAAKTPEERKALMGEHMKTMQDGMSTMNGMMSREKSANMTPMPPAMMQKKMEMMQMMMQMMMDQMGPPAPAK